MISIFVQNSCMAGNLACASGVYWKPTLVFLVRFSDNLSAYIIQILGIELGDETHKTMHCFIHE